MRVLGYLTPEEIPAETICRALYIPDDQYIIQAVYGALLELTYHWNWDEFGAITPVEISEALLPYVIDFMGSACVPNTTVDYFYHRETQNVAGGGITANTDTVVPFAEYGVNQAGNVSYNAGVFIVAAGEYEVEAWHVLRGDVASNQLMWLATDQDSVSIAEGLHMNAPANVQSILRVYTHLVLTAGAGFRFYARSSDTRATDALGVASNVSGHDEVYGACVWRRIGDA